MVTCDICREELPPGAVQNPHRCCAGRWCITCEGTLPKSGNCPYCRQPYVEKRCESIEIMHSNAQFTIMFMSSSIQLSWRRNGRLHREDDRPALIWYTDDGIMMSQYWYRDDRWHREGDLPAVINYREDGTIMTQGWYRDGLRHRDGDEPTVISYKEDGTIKLQRWYSKGRLHREGDGPAEIKYNESGAMVSQRYYRHGSK